MSQGLKDDGDVAHAACFWIIFVKKSRARQLFTRTLNLIVTWNHYQLPLGFEVSPSDCNVSDKVMRNPVSAFPK